MDAAAVASFVFDDLAFHGDEHYLTASSRGCAQIQRAEWPASLHEFEYEEFLLNPARKNVQVQIGSIGQEPVWEVSYHMPAKGQNDGQLVAVEYTLSPSKGNLPIRIVTRFTDQNGTTYRKSIDCELEQFPSGNVWFPARIAFRIESGTGTDEQVLTVKHAHFNDSIDDDVFLGKGLFDVQ